MKFQKSFAHSFRLKVALAMVLSLLFVTALSNYLIYQFALRAQFEQLRQQLKMTASAAAVSVDAELLGKVP
ncbi:MAG: hypothetical protein WCG06_04655, partial [Candidatus Omnitrophota bacterium]